MSPLTNVDGIVGVHDVWICILEQSDVEDIMALERVRMLLFFTKFMNLSLTDGGYSIL